MSNGNRHILFDDYTYEIVDAKTFFVFFNENRAKVFDSHFLFDFRKHFTSAEKERLSQRRNNLFSLHLFILHQNEIIGWFFGFQKYDSFYMCNTGLFKTYRNKGIYTALLPQIIKRLKAEGFATITSKHLASNNAVLIPKLKAGFQIKGMEIDENFGTMINLVYYNNSVMQKAYLMRTGEEKLKSL